MGTLCVCFFIMFYKNSFTDPFGDTMAQLECSLAIIGFDVHILAYVLLNVSKDNYKLQCWLYCICYECLVWLIATVNRCQALFPSRDVNAQRRTNVPRKLIVSQITRANILQREAYRIDKIVEKKSHRAAREDWPELSSARLIKYNDDDHQDSFYHPSRFRK